MFTQKRANTRNELLGLGLEDYSLPMPGEYIATLDYKQWGKSVNLWIYLTTADGQKIKISCFKAINKSIYSARDNIYDFSVIGNEGFIFQLLIGITKNNKPAFLSAIKL